jgi:hypothetical protein
MIPSQFLDRPTFGLIDADGPFPTADPDREFVEREMEFRKEDLGGCVLRSGLRAL